MGVRNDIWQMMIIWLVVFLCTAVPVSAQPDSTAVDLAIAPFANNTGRVEAHTQLMPLLEELLGERGIRVVSSESLRPLLRQYRVRSRGWISRRGADLIAGQSQAPLLLLGSWDVLQSGDNLELGVSMRLLDLHHQEIVAAVSVGGSGEDKVKWLDRGRISDPGVLARAVLTEALDGLLSGAERGAEAKPQAGCRRLAIVPLDNFSATAHAGDIVTGILLSQLVSAGYFVVEPGFVRELGLVREVVNRGGVDRASAQAILDDLGACQVITGAVQEFAPARGLPSVSVPRFAVGLRFSSTSLGTLLAMSELEGSGGDSDGVFQLGRVHAITPLAVAQINKFIAGMSAKIRKDSLDDQQVK